MEQAEKQAIELQEKQAEFAALERERVAKRRADQERREEEMDQLEEQRMADYEQI